MIVAFSLVVALSGLFWLTQLVFLLRAKHALLRVEELPRQPLDRYPMLSVVVPSKDEGATIEASTQLRLLDPYPALEIIVVNDRSSDSTGEVAERIAQTDKRVRVVHLTSLPEGWLGKVHAMQRGLEASRGEWVLFSDADVRISAPALSRIIEYAERDGVDHIAVLPSCTACGLLLAPALGTFFRFLGSLTRLWQVSNPRSTTAFGAGAFNLVRRKTLERTEVLASLKMEIADDYALGVLLKRSGASQRVLVGGSSVALDFYPSAAAMVGALEKNGAAAPAFAMILGALALVGLDAGFLLGFMPVHPGLLLASIATYLLAATTQLLAARWLGLASWPALFPFVGVFLLAYAIARSAILCALRGGVRWRSTFYSTDVVRAGSRLGPRANVSSKRASGSFPASSASKDL